MSPEMIHLVSRMVQELSSLKYVYKEYAIGCYDALVEHHNYDIPPESKDEVIDKVFEVLRIANDMI